MKYPWEQEFLDYINSEEWTEQPENIEVIAIAVINTETGEAALIEVNDTGEFPGSVTQADYRKDILGDAQARYQEALHDMAEEWQRVRRIN